MKRIIPIAAAIALAASSTATATIYHPYRSGATTAKVPPKAAAILAHIHPVAAAKKPANVPGPRIHTSRACGGWGFCVNAYHPVNYGGGVWHYDSTLEGWPGFTFQEQANFQILINGVWYTASGSWATNGWWRMSSNLFDDGNPGVSGVPHGYLVRNQTSTEQLVNGDYPTATDTSQAMPS